MKAKILREVICVHCGKILHRDKKCKNAICFDCRRKQMNEKYKMINKK